MAAVRFVPEFGLVKDSGNAKPRFVPEFGLVKEAAATTTANAVPLYQSIGFGGITAYGLGAK